MKPKIGILLPRSDMYPALASDYMKGIKQPIKDHDIRNRYEFLVEGVGTASDEMVLKSAEKLLLQEDAAIVFAFCSHSILDKMVAMFDAYKKPLVHLDLGGNCLQRKQCSAYVAHHSLNLCHLAYASGRYAAHNYGKKALVASSFYDGGYQIHNGFEKGFKDSGGTDVGYFVSAQNYKEQSPEALLARVYEDRPDVIFGLYSYNEGAKMFEVLADRGVTDTIPFMTTPIMTDEFFVTENYNLNSVFSMASWSFDDEDTAMQSWIGEYVGAYEEKPGIFALLGHECQAILKECLADNDRIPKEIGRFLQERSLNTPRGKITFNTYGESQPEYFKLRKFEFNKVQYHNTVVDTIENKNSVLLNEHFEGQQFSGWTNPYICT